MVTEVINIRYLDHEVGAISFNKDIGLGSFEYFPSFIKKGIQLSPLKMPLSNKIYTFPELDFNCFKGLPGLVADSLPDDFGNAVLEAYLASKGKYADNISPIQKLVYTGKRGMGALEFYPSMKINKAKNRENINFDALVKVAQEVLNSRREFSIAIQANGSENKEAMLELISVGVSAGGARPKAVLAFDSDFSQARSGQIDAPEGFTHYLMKFDGVSEHNRQRETFGDPIGFGAMEYVYAQLAKNCKIRMMPCRLLEEGRRRHFITKRFDRIGNEKIHVQTLTGIAHINFQKPGNFSFTELFGVARQLKLTAIDAEQLMRRLIFNIVARNHDDHPKNIAFIFRDDKWTLAPAYDLTYSYKPGSNWVNSHYMSLNGKRDNFTRQDFFVLEKISPLFTKERINRTIDEIVEQVSKWKTLALDNNVPKSLIDEVESNLRLKI